jgi:hypothetical protein
LRKVEIVQYHPVHAQIIADAIKMTKHPDFSQWIVDLKAGGPAYTLLIDEQIACCAGICMIGWNRGEAWLLFSPLAFLHVKTCFKIVKEHLLRIVKEKGLKRLQATVKVGDEPAERFIRHLGFHCETPIGMKAYGPHNEDMFLFARVF